MGRRGALGGRARGGGARGVARRAAAGARQRGARRRWWRRGTAGVRARRWGGRARGSQRAQQRARGGGGGRAGAGLERARGEGDGRRFFLNFRSGIWAASRFRVRSFAEGPDPRPSAKIFYFFLNSLPRATGQALGNFFLVFLAQFFLVLQYIVLNSILKFRPILILFCIFP